MCLACIEYQMGKLTRLEFYKNLSEMGQEETDEALSHAKELLKQVKQEVLEGKDPNGKK